MDTQRMMPLTQVPAFPKELRRGEVFSSVPGGPATLYGTCYGILANYYLGEPVTNYADALEFILGCQSEREGAYFVGPELAEWSPAAGAKHDREHLLLHLACATLPVLQEMDTRPRMPLRFAHRFCDAEYLSRWLDSRDLADAWREGNNILFVGQLLVYLRDEEGHSGAERALVQWFDWLDARVDPRTGLWGTDRGASVAKAVFGGYHQLLVYYCEGRPVQHRERLVDAVLRLQHRDGGFCREGGGGACEDVDAVDILVNMYKQMDYRRPEIRIALRRCLHQILVQQNPDGGFPYKRDASHSHNGVPATAAGPNISTAFATWFRIHTVALIAEVLTDELPPEKADFRFNRALSMGWHKPWDRKRHRITAAGRAAEHAIPLLGAARRATRRAWTTVARRRKSSAGR